MFTHLEEVFRASTGSYWEILNAFQDALIIHDPKTGFILDANQRACELFKYSREELIKRSFDILDSGERPYTKEEAVRWIQRALLEGPQVFEWLTKDSENNFFWTEVTLKHFEINGNDRVLAFGRDITARKKAEKELLENEKKYRLLYQEFEGLLDAIPDNIALISPELKFIWANKDVAFSINKTLPDVIGQYCYQVRHNRTEPCESCPVLRSFQSKQPETEEITTADGISVDIRTVPIIDEQGGVKGIIEIARNITESKQAEKKLRKSENEKSILNQIANIFLTAPDKAMYEMVLAVVFEVMRSKYGIFGFIGDQGELIIPSLTRDIWNECQVADKSVVFPSDSWGDSIWGKAIREKKAFFSDGPFCIPEGHVHIDNFLTVPIVFGQKTIGLLSVANKEGGYNKEDKDLLECIAGNISPILNARLQRDKLEHERKQGEEMFRGLAANSPVGVYIVQNGKFVYTNQQFQRNSGYREDELLGMDALSLIFPEDREIVRKNAIQMLKGKSVFPYEFRTMNKKGEVRWALETVASIKHQGNRAIISSYQDITERKKTEKQMLSLQAQLRQSQKMEAIGRLAGGVAHDFNNLLTVISIQTQLALKGLKETDPLKEKLKDIEYAAERAEGLTRQLLAFSRRQILEKKVFNLNTIVRDLEKMLRRIIGEDIELKTKLADDLGVSKIDPGQIEQVIVNLAVNAKDAMPRGGKLTVETANEELDESYAHTHMGVMPGAYVLLSVTDTGIGMSKEVQEQIFEPFFTTKEMGKGTGLGLATVYGIVKQSGGDIYVYSEPEKGTTFKIYFPRVFEPGDKIGEKEVREEICRGTETIAVVEDDDMVRKLAVDILKDQGYRVMEANEGEKALSMCEQYNDPIHLILTDVVMPHMSGVQFIERLKQVREDFKVVYMTGYAEEAITHDGFFEKEVNLIQKPFAIERLAKKIREVLDKK